MHCPASAARDGKLNAFVLVTEDRALADARRADDELKSGRDRGPFHGIPYALKDIYDTAGIRTTCHSKLRLNNVPQEDSVAAARLREAGGVLLGKLATHEFAIGGPSFDLPFPPARNPWHPRPYHRRFVIRLRHRDRRAHGAHGDGFGHRRFHPRPRRMVRHSRHQADLRAVSRRGVFPLSWTLDHIGPLSKSVEDSAITLQVLAGHDAKDPASAMFRSPTIVAIWTRASQACVSAFHARSSPRRRPPRAKSSLGSIGPRRNCETPAPWWRTSNYPTMHCSPPSAA